MEFKNLLMPMQKNFIKMTKNIEHLFVVDVDKDELWNLYLDSFSAETNEIFRVRREYDCSCCRHFIKSFGNVVSIEDNEIHTLWDFEPDEAGFKPVVDALAQYVKSHSISNVYVRKDRRVGTEYNFEERDGTTIKWEHFYLDIPAKFVSGSSKSIGDLQGEFSAVKGVFKRSLDEITENSVLTVLELIASNSLYKGEEWKATLEKFLSYKKAYAKLPDEKSKELFAWEQSVKAGPVIGKIRNHSIGTLLVDISEGIELDEAVRRYEVIVAPSNYKRPKAIFTKKMLEDAQKTIESLGYMDSLARRYAAIDDITVNNILFYDKDTAKKKVSKNIFDEMQKVVVQNPKKFSKVEAVSIEDFIGKILPVASSVEVLMENKLSSNLMSLITAQNKDSKPMFKWDNNFSWAYSGNITDSMIRENVKNAGGKVDGVLRFSIQWNDGGDYNPNDFDAHCIEPAGGKHLYYGDRMNSRTGGNLDIDITHPFQIITAVENITWPNKTKMLNGKYKFFVNNYCHRGGRSGFKSEIEFDGTVHSFFYDKELGQDENVEVAEVSLVNGVFTIEEKLPSNVASREVWGVTTNQFVPVSTVMYSPNYWDEHGVGNKHYFFMLKGCINPEQPNGMFNEYLKEELLEHKRVFEALGGKCRVEESDDQLSGLGFSSTQRNEIIVRVKGQTERVLKVEF